MEEPIKASEVEKLDEGRTQEDADRDRARRVAAARRARRDALKKAGAENVGSPALHENIEAGLEKRRQQATQRFRASEVARDAVANKRRPKGSA